MASGAARSILTSLDDAAAGDRGFIFLESDEERLELPYAELRERASSAAAVLAHRGVGPGSAVGILGPNAAPWVVWAYATWMRGACVVPLPFGAPFGDLAGYMARLRRLAEAADCSSVVADPRFIPAFDEALPIDWGTTLDLDPVPPADLDPDAVAVRQFTSGTTSDPKIAELSHRAVSACVGGILESLAIGEDDVSFSWLPFFHDNGLFGHMIGPIAGQVDGVILPTERFGRNPALWFRSATETGATVTSGPCSAWAVALKAAQRKPAGIDLSRLRMGIFGAEAIDAAVIDRFDQHGHEFGLRPGTLVGAYGLAEATLMVTVGASGSGMRFDEVDHTALGDRGVAEPTPGSTSGVRRIASCGSPTPVYEVRISGADGPLADRVVGEIEVSGAGLMTGYRGIAREEQPIRADGWLRTGDLGYLADGELFVTGRSKDLIIVFGRNFAPEEFEWATNLVAGVRAGRCVAFSNEADGEGAACVVFEVSPGSDPEATAAEVRRKVGATLNVALGDVVPAVKGTIRKTTSGKLQRGLVRDAYLRGEIVRVTAT